MNDLMEKIVSLELQIRNLERMTRQQSAVIEANLGEDAALLAIAEPVSAVIQ